MAAARVCLLTRRMTKSVPNVTPTTRARSRRGKTSAGDLDCENIGVTDKNGQDALKVVNAIILVMTYELVNRHFFRQIERLQSLEKAEKGDF